MIPSFEMHLDYPFCTERTSYGIHEKLSVLMASMAEQKKIVE